MKIFYEASQIDLLCFCISTDNHTSGYIFIDSYRKQHQELRYNSEESGASLSLKILTSTYRCHRSIKAFFCLKKVVSIYQQMIECSMYNII